MAVNLIVTYEPTHSGMAQAEVKAALQAAGEKSPKLVESKVDGILKLQVSDAKKLVKKACESCKKTPEKFSHTFHWIPIDVWTKSDAAAMKKEISKIVPGIKQSEKWKLDLGKRMYDKLHTTELIKQLTEPVDRPNVDLKKPDKIIEVQIIGSEAGISLLNKDELLDVPALTKKK